MTYRLALGFPVSVVNNNKQHVNSMGASTAGIYCGYALCRRIQKSLIELMSTQPVKSEWIAVLHLPQKQHSVADTGAPGLAFVCQTKLNRVG